MDGHGKNQASNCMYLQKISNSPEKGQVEHDISYCVNVGRFYSRLQVGSMVFFLDQGSNSGLGNIYRHLVKFARDLTRPTGPPKWW